jgi:hypothetical protein
MPTLACISEIISEVFGFLLVLTHEVLKNNTKPARTVFVTPPSLTILLLRWLFHYQFPFPSLTADCVTIAEGMSNLP